MSRRFRERIPQPNLNWIEKEGELPLSFVLPFFQVAFNKIWNLLIFFFTLSPDKQRKCFWDFFQRWFPLKSTYIYYYPCCFFTEKMTRMLQCSKREFGLPRWLSGKESAFQAGDTGSIPGLGRSFGEGNGTHSSILGWEIPWTEEPDGLQSMGLQKVRHDLATK